MNILVTMELLPEHRGWLEAAGPNETFRFETKPGREDVRWADVIFGNVPPRLLSPNDRLRWMQTGSAGVDGYLGGALPDGCVLTNATGAYGLAISEYMVAAWLALLKKLPLYRDRQKECDWRDMGPVGSVWNSTVLVLGLGDIGGEFAKRAKALGAYVIGMRRTGTKKPEFVDELIHPESLPGALSRADCVAVSLPGTEATRRMLDGAAFSAMKDGAVLLNVGRGTVVDTEALLAALRSGKLSGAALDVTDPEPLPADHPLWQMENVLVTPHVSGGFHLRETHDRIVRIMAENLRAYLSGRPLKNIVDMQTGYRRLPVEE